MLEAVVSPFMQKAFAAGTLVSLVMGILSVFVVLRKLSFIGTGISHAAFGGVAIGFYAGINPLVSAIFYTVAVAAGINVVSRSGKVAEDVSIGIFYSVSMAVGVALTSLSRAYTIDLFGYLFGNILTISRFDMILTICSSTLVGAFILLFLKEMFLATYNRELAQVSGIRVRFLDLAFLICLAVSIVISIRVVGIILVSALLVIPGATARVFARGLPSMIIVSCIVSFISVWAGLLLSYRFDVASGASIVLTAAALFFCSLLLKRSR